MKKSLIRKYLVLTNLFGLSMGIIFPVYASFFVDYKSDTHQIIFIVGAVAAGIMVGGFSYFLTKKIILTAIRDISDSFESLANDNDLKISIDIKSDDEIGMLSQCANLFINKIHNDMIEISEYTKNLEKASIELKNTQKSINIEIAVSNEETSKINKYISLIESESSDSYGKLSKRVIPSITKINKDVNEINQNFGDINENSMEIEKMTRAIDRAIRKVSNMINNVSQSTSNAANISLNAKKTSELTTSKMSNLNEYARNIENIINLIENIANKTNLLAINATIEASKAGEAGKGFGVVANEIKSLASQTNKATAKIKVQIKEIQNNMQEGMDNVNNLDLVINELNEINVNIANEFEEQSSNIDEVSNNTSATLDSVKNNNEYIIKISNNLNNSTENIKIIDKDISLISMDSKNTNKEIKSISKNIESMKEIMNNLNKSSHVVNDNANNISEISEKLSKLLEKFNL